MLRNRLFKRFGKDGIEEPVDLNPKATNLSNPQLTDNPDNAGELLNLPGFIASPQEKWDWQTKVNPKVPELDMSSYVTLDTNQVPTEDQRFSKSNELTKTKDAGSLEKNWFDQFKGQEGDALSLGLLGIDAALGYNQDLKNQRKFNESIQQRNSKPLYDYNYMYGRTSSGGTQRNNIVQAEMGAQINKRYSSGGENNVEIEGGEFIQLPNFQTEMASGPSHENGGIPTNLPDQTRVYSNSLKPEGSKKTFAQIAKKYDNTSFKKTAENPFAKQVDKDTANIMMQRNQRILDDLFKDQQYLNGNSNGELEARNGASINNAGFKALPENVQEKILAEMQYGGYAQKEAASLEMAKGGKKNPQPSADSLPPQIRNYAKWDPTFQKKDGSVGAYRLEVPAGLDQDALTGIARAAESYGISNLVQTSNTRMQGAAGIKGFHSGLSPQDFEKKIVAESLGKEQAGKLNELDTRNKAFELMGVNTEGYDINDASKLYGDEYFREKSFYPAFQKYLPQGKFRAQEGDDKMFGFEHYDAIKAKTPPGEIPPPGKPNEPETPEYNPAKDPITGKYTRGQFPLYQAIPEAMGLAQSQEIFPYAIPELDAPYVRPQTLNIQSELQDIDNMGTATMRAGADPLQVYIAGLDAKQKAFQAKQNYDAEGRWKADTANAEMSFNADKLNQGAFDAVYNTQIANARDAQSYEKQAALASLVTKKGQFTQDENLKALGIPIVAPGYDVTSDGQITLPKGYKANFVTAKKGMYKKSKY